MKRKYPALYWLTECILDQYDSEGEWKFGYNGYYVGRLYAPLNA